MRKLRRGDPILVVHLNRTWKARVTFATRSLVFFYVPAFDDSKRVRSTAVAPLREEGKTWAWGWDTDEAKTLQVVEALR